MMKMAGIEEDDIVTASFVNHVDIVPFFVVKIDRDGAKELIIAIRGTLSIKVSQFSVNVTNSRVLKKPLVAPGCYDYN